VFVLDRRSPQYGCSRPEHAEYACMYESAGCLAIERKKNPMNGDTGMSSIDKEQFDSERHERKGNSSLEMLAACMGYQARKVKHYEKEQQIS
jgi:hypothetical protein